MKIAFINGSPKTKDSASEVVLKSLKKHLADDVIISEHHFRTPHLDNNDIEKIADCNVIVIAFPLYADGIPSHVINCFYQMETFFKTNANKDIKVYALVNCGFYEGKQNTLALEMVERWCERSGVTWRQGLGIGGGGMLTMILKVPDGKGPMKNLWKALKDLANNISTLSSAENIFVSPNIPRFAYKFGAELGWRQQIKANGLSTKDLSLRK